MEHACELPGISYKRERLRNLRKRINTAEDTPSLDEVDSDVDNEVLSQARYKYAVVDPGKTRYTCEECDRSFSRKAHLVGHMHIHSGLRPYSCGHCQQTFTRKENMHTHMLTHTGLRPYCCTHCGKSFVLKHNLISHEKLHSGLKPYSCGDCDKAFTTNILLVYHTRTHTGERPYVCSVCEKAFTTSSHLSRHRRTHTGLTPYNCPHCDVRFTDKGNMNRHIRLLHKSATKPRVKNRHKRRGRKSAQKSSNKIDTHGPMDGKCQLSGTNYTAVSEKDKLTESAKTRHEKKPTLDISDKSSEDTISLTAPKRNGTTSEQDLYSHNQASTADNGLTCEVCDRTFTDEPALKRHELIHIHCGDKPHTCHVCHVAFSGKHHLKQHLKSHKSEKIDECDGRVISVNGPGKRMHRHTENTQHTSSVFDDDSKPECHDTETKLESALADTTEADTTEAKTDMAAVDLHYPMKFGRRRCTAMHNKNIRPTCDVCDESFLDERVLERHMRIHTWENSPFI